MNGEIGRQIREAMINLLKRKEYKDIQMKEIAESAHIGRRTLYRYYACKDDIMDGIVARLMDDFAVTVKRNQRMDLEGIAYAYFMFWENNLEKLRLLKKAHLMYLLEDNLPELVMGVSAKTKYRNLTGEELMAVKNRMSQIDYYNYCYMLSGYFKVAQLWMQETDRKSPEEMAVIMRQIVLREEQEAGEEE